MEPEKRHHLRTGLLSAVFAAASLCAVHQAAQAGPVTEAGELVGLAMGAPLPEGVYFVDTASMVSLGPKNNTTLFVNIPVVGYSTPWKLLGGRVEGYIAVPELYLGVKNAASTAGLDNPALLVGEAWDLGNGSGIAERMSAADVNFRYEFFGSSARVAVTSVSMPVLMVGSASGAHWGEWVPGSLVLSAAASQA